MKFLSVVFGGSLFLAAMFIAVMTLISIADPVSVKMADDNDPFGPPPSRASSLAIFCASVGVGMAGVYLAVRPFRLPGR